MLTKYFISIFIAVLLSACSVSSEDSVTLTDKGGLLEFSGRFVKAKFIQRDGHIYQEYYARKNDSWEKVVESYHSPAIVLQEKGLFAALVPDLNAINRYAVLSPDARRTIDIERNQFSVPFVPEKYTMPTGLDKPYYKVIINDKYKGILENNRPGIKIIDPGSIN
jgi:hypothetical protein